MFKQLTIVGIMVFCGLGGLPTHAAAQEIRLITEAGYHLNCFDSKGAVQGVDKKGQPGRDETFLMVRITGEGPLKHGDKVAFRTAGGCCLNCNDSTGPVKGVNKGRDGPGRDEVFTVIRIKGAGVVGNNDKIALLTHADTV